MLQERKKAARFRAFPDFTAIYPSLWNFPLALGLVTLVLFCSSDGVLTTQLDTLDLCTDRQHGPSAPPCPAE